MLRPYSTFSRTAHRQGGNALVEFAVMLPSLVLLLALLGEGAAMLSSYEVVVNAARAGARLSAVPGELGRTSDVVNRVLAYASANGITLSAGNVSVQQAVLLLPGGGTCGIGNPCILASRVAVTDPYTLHYLPKLPFGIPTTAQLGAVAIMRNFY
ncbi:MAG: hypothetical protein EPN33_09810 [Acidobacteria bacterium]|nr:MAG: hypothetical protein EPN33_09810 [Acidobacteriota bacterium]